MSRLLKPFKNLTFVALLFYIVLALITLRPILETTGTHTAGYDFFAYNWNFWYTRYALTQPDVALFESNFVMFPHVSSFGYHTLTIFWFPIWAVFEPIIGTLAAVNIILFLGCVLNGFMVFLLLRSEKVAPALALLGGAVVQILPITRYFYYNTHLNLMDWFLPPFHILLWKQLVNAANQKAWRKAMMWAAINGIALWWMCFSDLQSPIFVGFLLVPYGLYTLWHSPQRLQIIGLGILTVVITVALLWFLGPLPYMLEFEGTRVISPADERPGIQFIEGFFTMSETWWSHETPTTGWFITVFLIVTLIFALLKRNQPRNDKWFWFAAMIPPILIAMGPTLKIGGTSLYHVVFDLTDGMFRMPWRLGPVFAAAGMVFAGKVWTPYLPKITPRLVIFVVLFLSLFFSVRVFETAPLQPLLPEYKYY